jgi:hypothetical protein
MFDWLKKLFNKPSNSQPARSDAERRVQSVTNQTALPVKPAPAVQPRPVSYTPPVPQPAQPEVVKPSLEPHAEEAQAYLRRLHEKVDSLAERFARGGINRKQFEELFAHYQGEIQSIGQFLAMNPDSEEWKNLVSEGQSILIRRKHAAHLVGVAIYDQRSGLPIRTVGEFGVDPALFVPMLYAYQSATKEIFGAAVRSTQIEGGKWLSFIPGQVTTTLALFSSEPSQEQIKTMENIHRVFETANINQLRSMQVDADALVCPHEYYVGRSF